MSRFMIPITVVEFGSEEEQLVLEVLRSGRVAQGPLVARFEQMFAEMTGVKHAIAVNNGTTSLVAALQSFDLEPGDEVITSPFTFAATLNAILEAGATARFADISEADFNVDPDSVASRISNRTRVLMPVHLYGQVADMERLMPIARRHDLLVLEDAAQAHGSTQSGKAAGSFGVGSFSFYATKNITTGEGGIITTDDDEFADRLRVLRNQGMRARYEYVMRGHNYRMTDLQAALGIPQISRYDATVSQRAKNAAYLSAGLNGIPGLITPKELVGRRHVWHQYTVRITEEAAVSRDEFAEKITAAGVGAGVYYPRLVFDYDAYRDRSDVVIEPTPVANRIAREAVSLPVHTHLSRVELDEIIATTRRILGAK
ncbi:DegT/DnrJ/EryC1/StrS family aminotransferase [Microbacterium sp. QXD-8]|uniref:DegT/DnrJ/EryC1/StrS family aminotransferase n=1 Tax=Microbacterium psychrotolerans TaxID=3068321 RepID=A0ABU0Z2E1_9MICO|nr:DegT/DnrJ/EryC1/StrS family aminotransferase [Microbacterium sp. QXD-8]MDQ7878755.1 DegT/DnrJ/EryC1/StrS family aminotransferase [Microbacterium sp. QXD-8]